MGWDSIGIVFDEEPMWDSLEALNPDANLRGYRHRKYSLWLFEAWLNERASEHYMFQSRWPERFELPPGLTLPEGYASFLEKVIIISGIVRAFSPLVLLYGMTAATLTGKRTYLWGADDEDFNLAMLVHDGEVIALGAEGGMMDITWEDGQFVVQCTRDPDEPDFEPTEKELELLESLSCTRVIREPIPCRGELYRWPVRIWPSEWGKPEEVLGLGTWDYTEVWDRDLEVCYDRSGRQPPEPPSRGIFGKVRSWLGG